jgi:hypothetical protein
MKTMLRHVGQPGGVHLSTRLATAFYGHDRVKAGRKDLFDCLKDNGFVRIEVYTHVYGDWISKGLTPHFDVVASGEHGHLVEAASSGAVGLHESDAFELFESVLGRGARRSEGVQDGGLGYASEVGEGVQHGQLKPGVRLVALSASAPGTRP